MQILLSIFFAILLVSILATSQDAFGLETKATKKSYDTQSTSKPPPKHNKFVSNDWLFSIMLPPDWNTKTRLPFHFASAHVFGNQVIVDYVTTKKSFTDRNDFHSYLLATEVNSNGFDLNKSITTVDTKYGYKSIIEMKLKKQDGNQMLLRKDFHFVNDGSKMYSVYGYSHDAASFKSLKMTLDTFKPIT